MEPVFRINHAPPKCESEIASAIRSLLMAVSNIPFKGEAATTKRDRHHLNFNSRVVFGGEISKRNCASDGLFTFERRPSFWRRRWTSCHDGGSSESCSQWATEASSHHCRSRGITLRCGPAIMKARIDCSSFHTVRVQKVKRASLSTEPQDFPTQLWPAEPSGAR
jgi:hypothetical protein